MTQPLRILIIEHDRPSRELAQAVLSLHGHQAASCRGAAEALRCYLEQTPAFDVIILDIEFPEQGGLEIAERLREHPATRDVPILCSLALSNGHDRMSALEAGCDRILAKPYRSRDLIEALRELCAVRPSTTELTPLPPG